GAEPDELVGANVDIDSERSRIGIAETRVAAVRGDDEIVFAPFRVGGIALGIEVKLDSELERPILEDFEQALAADADETVAARGDGFALEVDVDVVPMRELFGDDLRGQEIVPGDVVDG